MTSPATDVFELYSLAIIMLSGNLQSSHRTSCQTGGLQEPLWEDFKPFILQFSGSPFSQGSTFF